MPNLLSLSSPRNILEALTPMTSECLSALCTQHPSLLQEEEIKREARLHESDLLKIDQQKQNRSQHPVCPMFRSISLCQSKVLALQRARTLYASLFPSFHLVDIMSDVPVETREMGCESTHWTSFWQRLFGVFHIQSSSRK